VVDAVLEDVAIDSVPVSEQVFRRGVPGKGLEDLQSSPLGGGIGGDIEIQDSPAVMAEGMGRFETSERKAAWSIARVSTLLESNSPWILGAPQSPRIDDPAG